MSSFFLQKNSIFLPKKYLFSKQQCESGIRDVLVLFSGFVREKVTITENITFADSKLAKNPKNDNDVTVFWHDVVVNFFDVILFLLSILVTDHVNIHIGSGVMTIFFYKGLTRNLKIRDIPVWVLPNIWRLEHVMDTKFGTNVSNRMLLNAAKYHCSSLYRFHLELIFRVPPSESRQTHSNNSSANCRRIVWVCLTILWGWRLKSFTIKLYLT